MSFGRIKRGKRSELHILIAFHPKALNELDKHRQVSWLSTLLIRLPVRPKLIGMNSDIIFSATRSGLQLRGQLRIRLMVQRDRIPF